MPENGGLKMGKTIVETSRRDRESTVRVESHKHSLEMRGGKGEKLDSMKSRKQSGRGGRKVPTEANKIGIVIK